MLLLSLSSQLQVPPAAATAWLGSVRAPTCTGGGGGVLRAGVVHGMRRGCSDPGPGALRSPRYPALPSGAPERRKRRPFPPPVPHRKVTPLCLHAPGGRAPPPSPPQPMGGSGRGRRTGEGRAPDPSVRPAQPFPLLSHRTSGPGRSF